MKLTTSTPTNEGQAMSFTGLSFLRLVLIANLVAYPVAWYFMDQWLQDFAYHISIGPEVFVGTGLVSIVVSLSPVVFHAAKTAKASPTTSLRYE